MARSRTNTFELGLRVTEQLANHLQGLRDGSIPLDSVSNVFPFRIAAKFGSRALVVPGPLFSVHKDHVTVRGIGELATRAPVVWRAAGLKKEYLAFVEKPAGWSAYIRMATPSHTKTPAKKKREKFSEAALYVTDKSPAQKVSGGLPSLGKRR